MKDEEVDEKMVKVCELLNELFPNCACMVFVAKDSMHITGNACCKCMAEDIIEITEHRGSSPKHDKEKIH